MVTYLLWLLIVIISTIFNGNSFQQLKNPHFLSSLKFRWNNGIRNTISSIPDIGNTKIVNNTMEIVRVDSKFDLGTAILLAGYSFEAYNEPRTGKISLGADGTKLTYTSTQYINQVFQGVVMITLLSGEFLYKESETFEVLATGVNPDPYISMTIEEDSGTIVDTATSTVKNGQSSATWKENFFLYVKNPQTSILKFHAYDKDLFKEDDLVGVGELSILNLIENGKFCELVIPVPLYTPVSISKSIGRPFTRKRVGTLNIEARFIPWGKYREDSNMSENTNINTNVNTNIRDSYYNMSSSNTSNTSKLPSGSTPECDWKSLLSLLVSNDSNDSDSYPRESNMKLSLSSSSLSQLVQSIQNNLHQICYIDNDATDTQVGIWANIQSKLILVSFRGTEQLKFKDILTDINLIQIPYDESISEIMPVKVHSGFAKALQSVQGTILYVLESLFSINLSQSSSWSIYITGHSLGGALANLMAFELGLLRYGWKQYSLSKDSESIDIFDDAIKNSNIWMYSYGAPRVGNGDFAKIYDMLVPSSYRIVNDKDIVARLPRGYNATRFLEYEHAGKSVIIDDSKSRNIWIQGESDGTCPLLDISPFQVASIENKLQSPEKIAFGFDLKILLQDMTKFTNSTSWLIELATSVNAQVSNVQDSLMNKFKSLGLSNEGFSQLYVAYDLIEGLQRGLDESFIQKELLLFSVIINGTALVHHLEPSYFKALKNTFDSTLDL